MTAKRILLCDDEIHIVRAAEFKFRHSGYDVRTASDGEVAWRMILQECPDLLITDCQMPRLDGLELCRRIRERPETRNLPVIMLTAKGFELAAEELAETLGILAVVRKPFSPRAMLATAEELLGAAGPSTEACTPLSSGA